MSDLPPFAALLLGVKMVGPVPSARRQASFEDCISLGLGSHHRVEVGWSSL